MGTHPAGVNDAVVNPNPPLMPHQAKAVSELRNGRILKGGTGSGKTRTALAYYAQYAPWIPLYVITTAKKRDSGDWQQEADLFGVDVVVDSWNNLPSYDDVENVFFIFDEQRVVGSGIWVKAFLKITKSNKWILLSATPGDTWMDYIPVFVANGFFKNKTEFCDNHVVFNRFTKYPKVEKFIGTRRLASYLQRILVEMPFERHTTRHEVEVFAEYDKSVFDGVWRGRWNYLESRPVRQIGELCALLRRITNTHPSRLDRIRDLLVEHPRLIIFYNFDYELEILRELEITRGELNGHRHDPVPETDEWVYLVQYAAGAEAWNCISTNAMAFYSLTYSYRQFEQARGRIDRLNTPFTDLKYFVLKSSSWIDNSIRRALTEKRDFNEKSAVKQAAGV